MGPMDPMAGAPMPPEMMPPPEAPLEEQGAEQDHVLSDEILEAQEAMLAAITSMAAKARGSTNSQEAADFGKAILSLAQSVVILDPDLVAPQGVPIDALHPPAPKSDDARIQADKRHGHG